MRKKKFETLRFLLLIGFFFFFFFFFTVVVDAYGAYGKPRDVTHFTPEELLNLRYEYTPEITGMFRECTEEEEKKYKKSVGFNGNDNVHNYRNKEQKQIQDWLK